MSEEKNKSIGSLSDNGLDALASFIDTSEENSNPLGEEMPLLDLSPNWLNVAQDIPDPRYMLQFKGVGFAPIGGVHAITGHKKNGKTWLITMLMAATLGTTKLGELRLRVAQNIPVTPTVLYIDTEQEIENTIRVARRVHHLMGWQYKESNPRFRILWLREEDSAETRWKKVLQAIEEVKPNAVFLDGIRDVMTDFNDMEESSQLISKCMRIASYYELCLWAALHFNPGSEKMRGHLGTELGNKVTDTFVCTKNKKDGAVTFTVSQVDARGKDVDDFTFVISDEVAKFGIPQILGDIEGEPGKASVVTDEETMRNVVLEPMRKALITPLGFRALESALKSQNGIGTRKADDWIHNAEDLGIIAKNSHGNYKFVGIASQEATLPFEPTDDIPY